jgi:hypothetical protein
LPDWFQIRTFHQNRAADAKALPAYFTAAERSEATLPLSQKSPFAASRLARLEETKI